MRQIFETLFNLDDSMNIVPCLAESYEFIDSTTLYVSLRQGVKFHNGKDFNAEDVKFSLERAAASPLSQAIAGSISEVIVNSDYDVTIKLTEPFLPILTHLTHTAASIVNKETLEAIGNKTHGKYPVGTGPFILEKLMAGDRIELTRWDGYHGTLPVIERIDIIAVPDTSGRAKAIESGAADLAYDILPEDISRIEAGGNAYVIRSANLSSVYIGFNCQKPPFGNTQVRQAVNYAIDKDELIQSVYKGAGAPSFGPLADGVWASAQERLAPYGYDLEKAAGLLKDAGLEGGFNTSIWVGEDEQSIEIAQAVQAQLALINIECAIETLVWPSFLERTAAGEHDMFILGWVTVTGDPDYGLYSSFHSSKHGQAGNRSFYSNQRVDELLDAGRSETEPSAREMIYFEAQQIIRDDSPWIFIWQGEDINAARSNLHGFWNDKTGRHVLYHIYFE
jgi:peptide/nickel transport system substrate-binding protein